MTKSTTFSRSGVSASGVTEMSTWFDASTGTLVSWLTGTASSFTLRRFAYSFANSHAGPLHVSPDPEVFSTSHGALASTPTRSTPAFLIASIRGLAPGAGTGTSALVVSVKASTASPAPQRNMAFIGVLLLSVVSLERCAAETMPAPTFHVSGRLRCRGYLRRRSDKRAALSDPLYADSWNVSGNGAPTSDIA